MKKITLTICSLVVGGLLFAQTKAEEAKKLDENEQYRFLY